MKVLLPVAIFVVTNNVFIFCEILGESAWDHLIMFTICLPLACIFLIYSYAIVMNGKASDIFDERE